MGVVREVYVDKEVSRSERTKKIGFLGVLFGIMGWNVAGVW